MTYNLNQYYNGAMAECYKWALFFINSYMKILKFKRFRQDSKTYVINIQIKLTNKKTEGSI